MIRFHLDESVDHAIARGLHNRGIDVTTASDAGLLGAPDEDHLAFGTREHRVVVTSDADFLRLAQRSSLHAGIPFCPPGARSIGYVVRYLCLMHDCLDASDMDGQVEYL